MKQYSSIAIEQYNNKRGVTLLELLIAIALLGIMVVGLSSIETFSRYQITGSDRRVQLQQNAAFVMEHMAKNINRAMGNRVISNPVDGKFSIGDCAPQVFTFGIKVDTNNDGAADRIIGYKSDPCLRTVLYCSDCLVEDCGGDECNSALGWQGISSKISDFSLANPVADNYISVNITACWDPDGSPDACGSVDNPVVNLSSRIPMPSVSTN